MGNTSRYGWAYPEVTDPPNTALHLKNAEQAIEATVGGLDDTLAALMSVAVTSVASITTSATGISGVVGTEIMGDTLTASGLVSGATYRVTYTAVMTGTVNGNYFEVRLRYAAGASVTPGGTSFRVIPQTIVTQGNWEPEKTLIGEFVAPSSGQFTVGASLKRTAGAGTASIVAERFLAIDRVKAP